jgi:hypothetical protein
MKALVRFGWNATNVKGLAHKNGVISMARGQPDSATSGWFICVNDQPCSILAAPAIPKDKASLRSVGSCAAWTGSGRFNGAEHGGVALTPPIKILKGSRQFKRTHCPSDDALSFPDRFGPSPVLVENRPENLIEAVAAEGE